MITLQNAVQNARRMVPRGWSPLLKYISKIYPPARMYPATLKNSDILFLDLSEYMCHSYFYYGELPHERYTEAFFKQYINPGDVFLDIGANIGYFTRMVSAIVKDKGFVYAFEPMPSAHRLLQNNTKNLKNVKIYNFAVSDREGEGSFSIRNLGDTSSLGEDYSSNSVIKVKTHTIDNIFDKNERIDMIKIDVEGYEYEVLTGALQTIKSKKPLLYFEYIDNYANDRGITIEKFYSLLMPLGYSVGWINIDYPMAPLISTTPSSYLIAVPKNNRWNISI